jgi:DtxR family transcriptional regulator, Mn-dependent transcriptional regulator
MNKEGNYLSFTEENYIKAIFQLHSEQEKVNTNSIASRMHTKASSVTDMLGKLAAKKLIDYQKYQGVKLTAAGEKTAVHIIRKHRLWEVFMVEKLNFNWDEVHEIAEQLEHIQSEELVDRLDKFLGFPKFDPHGDPIPDKSGKMLGHDKSILLSDCKEGDKLIVLGVKESSDSFLKFLNEIEMKLGSPLLVSKKFEFDNSFEIRIGAEKQMIVSQHIARNIIVKKQ